MSFIVLFFALNVSAKFAFLFELWRFVANLCLCEPVWLYKYYVYMNIVLLCCKILFYGWETTGNNNFILQGLCVCAETD
jgi:hypothetical protein